MVGTVPVVNVLPPIADYGLLSNCEQCCLVAPDGSVEWLCLPRPDSPSVFGALLDRAAGSFRFGPSNAWVPLHRDTCRGRWCWKPPGRRPRAG
jgi:GH15 family glucan-1,4-alpha-glucosidase